MNYWDKLHPDKYGQMLRRHASLWSFVENFIKDKNIKSILEIGCGTMPKAKNWVKKYQAVDININTDAIHEDFNTMDVGKLDKCELLLACAVIEHCNGYSDFLEQTKRVNPKYALITFFNKLNRDKDYFMECEKEKDTLGKYPWNRYSMKGIETKLEELKLLDKSEFFTLNERNIILLIDFSK